MAEKLVKLQTELIKRLTKAISNFKKSPKDRITRSYLETNLESLEQLRSQFVENHEKIIETATEQEEKELPYLVEDKYDEFDEEYIWYKSVLKEKLRAVSTVSSGSSNGTSNNSGQSNNNSDLKLPRIQLPVFSGKYEEWQTFYDMFLSLVHTNENIPAVQKLHYLKSHLTGEPEILLRNFPITERNYEEAWTLLTKRYNNKRFNTNAVLKIFFSQKQITTESAVAIKQLLDTTTSCLKALQNMEIKTESWDAIVIYHVLSKLDKESHKQWETQLSMCGEDQPTWQQLVEFLETRFRSLEMTEGPATAKATAKTPIQQFSKQPVRSRSFHSGFQEELRTNEAVSCAMCGGQHLIYHCKKFLQQPVQERTNFVQTRGLCFNCLASDHIVAKCHQSSCCRKCGRRHHTILHIERMGSTQFNTNQRGDAQASQSGNTQSSQSGNTQHIQRGNTHPNQSGQRHSNQSENTQQNQSEESSQSNTTQVHTGLVANYSRGELQNHSVLLATAVVKANTINGRKIFVRALLDQGSQASFITQSTVQLLGLKTIPVNGTVSGLGDGQTRIKSMVSLQIESCHNPEIVIEVNAYVLGSLTSMLPSSKVNTSHWVISDNLKLADPNFGVPRKIDILLGAETYSEILLEGIIKSPTENLIAQNTLLGWIISGRANKESVLDGEVVSMHIHMKEDEMIRKFWEIETEPNSIQKRLTAEELRCEEIYETTTVRNEEGRFVVKLPFNSEDPECQYGKSKEIATRKLIALEKRLMRDPALYEEYRKVLNEHLTLNHMALVEKEEVNNPKAVYLPHHPVVREDKQTTKVRVVKNASSKGVNGVSLNDNLLVGPKIQQDLRHLLMRWRTHKICIVADLVKMYHQVLVSKEDTDFQRILWRFNPEMPIQVYRLLTLTFGTACAPYLAVKTLQRLADEEMNNFPIAAEITKRDYYMDDLMTGCNTEAEARAIYEEMNKLMKSGGFQLQKWSSNSEVLLQFIEKDKQDIMQSVPIKADNTLKVLGLQWNKETDNFEYTVNLPEVREPITKRQVLSDIARLYDPMGWIAPVVVSAKMIIQNLWKAKLDWDDELNEDLKEEWLKYREELAQIKNILIPRWVVCTPGCKAELHAFSDASRLAYAAAVYLRTIDVQGQVNVSLISAKTKVAPIEKELSIPRLELCGAALAAKLLSEISQVMNIPKDNLFGWTDSTVVLAWLKGGAGKWTTFVSNRVSEILTITEYEQWRHVTTDANPADCASRGLRPTELKNHAIWWRAPEWLWESHIDSEELNEEIETHEEERITSLTITKETKEEFVWERFSNLTRMLKVISYCRRLLNRKRTEEEGMMIPNYITTKEMRETLNKCIEQVQKREFKEEIQQLKNGGCLPKKSVLHTLNPFLDQQGILRVGGRIEQAEVDYDKRNPIILPANDHLTGLIISDAHAKTLHGGPQIMRNYLRATYWIIRGREQVKKCFRRCVTCLRHSKKINTQLMGQLPNVRLKPSKPFKSTGVDYAGPINVRFSPGRGSKAFKGYICLFICMVTRAIHLEVVTDLTAKGFIAAFRRFTSRRGHCHDLYSDNGTNFVGADKQLREMFDRAKSDIPEEIAELLTLEKTNWHFIPPYAPNFGGLWEAGVRSAKTHLRKVIGDSTLTYEELSTVLAQIEACLNSRPITVLSDDPNDPLPLTPGHFLVGEPLINVTDEDVSDKNITCLERWRLVQKMVNVFWKKWSKEYLVSLNQRYKWTTKKSEPDVEDVVILREDNVPPSKWILGVVKAKHAGPDNVTRVVTIKTKNGMTKRAISKVVMLEK